MNIGRSERFRIAGEGCTVGLSSFLHSSTFGACYRIKYVVCLLHVRKSMMGLVDGCMHAKAVIQPNRLAFGRVKSQYTHRFRESVTWLVRVALSG